MTGVEAVQSSRLIGLLPERLEEAIPHKLPDDEELAREDRQDHRDEAREEEPGGRVDTSRFRRREIDERAGVGKTAEGGLELIHACASRVGVVVEAARINDAL